MATTGIHNQERVTESLRQQLALAVRSIQWSYAIFWNISAKQPGILEWGDGYYNGDIKTRKTIQAIELNYDQLDLQRSEQLRELYESLSAGESNPLGSRRSSAALSPEDLTDTEWYYLVCMSFVFNIGEGLPGKSLANNQPLWLCNAHYADSEVFSRSLLAKSASIQTVVCFPLLQGVVEFGVAELVLEEPGFIQHIKTAFLEIPYPMISSKSSGGAGNARNDKDLACAALGLQIIDTSMVPVVRYEVSEMASPINSSNGIEHNQPEDEALVVEGINGVASQVQSWQFMEDDISNFVHHSMNCSDCISQTFVDAAEVFSSSIDAKVIDHCLQEVQECNHSKLTSLDHQGSDLHYQNDLPSLLKTSYQSWPHFHNRNQQSSFVSWKQGGLMNCKKQRDGISQKLLKKILFEVPRMNNDRLLESPKDNDIKDDSCRTETDEIAANHVLSERRRREKLNQRFVILKSMVPSISKFDKVSILDDTIEYLQELERKVKQLESYRAKLEARKGKPKDTIERTSDNYCKNRTSNSKPLVNKRKVRDTDEMDTLLGNVSVSMNQKDVQIEIKCPWREGILLEIMDAMSNLHLDSHSVQSSTNQGMFSLAIKTEVSNVTSAGIIKKSLQRVLERVQNNCLIP